LFSEIGRGGSDASDVSLDIDRVDGSGGRVDRGTGERFERSTVKGGWVGEGDSEGVVIVIGLLSGDPIVPKSHKVVSVDRRVGGRVVPGYQLAALKGKAKKSLLGEEGDQGVQVRVERTSLASKSMLHRYRERLDLYTSAYTRLE
jgi:hypothetical protein